MADEATDGYELGERAAIRQFDGGCEPARAEKEAAAELKQRAARDAAEATLPELRCCREQVRRAWLAETGPERQAELRGEWMDLSRRIAELIAGPQKGAM